MRTATAAAGAKTAVGIERIVECGHDASCLTLRQKEQGACHAPISAIAARTQRFAASLPITKTRDTRKFVG
jgi:hypothetical protein